MKKTVKMIEGLAVGMIIGGVAGAIITHRLQKCSGASRRFTKALRSACGMIESIF